MRYIGSYINNLQKYSYKKDKNISDFWFEKRESISREIFGNSGQDDPFSTVIRWKSKLGQQCQQEVLQHIHNAMRISTSRATEQYKRGIHDFVWADISFDDFSFAFEGKNYNLTSFANSFPTSQMGGAYDLRGIDLSGIRIQNAIIRNCFLQSANFSNSIISQVILDNVYLGAANFENSRFASIRFKNNSNLSGTFFQKSFINAASLNDDILGEGIIILPISYKDLLFRSVHNLYSNKIKDHHKRYTNFLANDTKHITDPKLKGLKSYIEWYQDLNYHSTYHSIALEKRSKILILLQVLTTKYWSSYKVLGIFTFFLNLIFASIIHYFSSNFKYPIELEPFDFFDSFYYSVVTFATLGYGDITPISWIGQLIVIINVTSGYVFLALFIFLLSKKIDKSV